MSSLNGRVTRLENQLGAMTWQEEIELLVKQGKMSPMEVITICGLLALEIWPGWYEHHDQVEITRLAQEATERNQALFARFSDAEIEAMLDGRAPFPEDL